MSTHEQAVQAVVESIGRRRRTLIGWQAAARAALGLVGIWAVALFATYLLRRDGEVMLGLMGAALALSALWLWRLWRSRPTPASPAELARFIEERSPGLDDRLVTAVQALRELRDPHGVRAALMADTARAVEDVNASDVVPETRLRLARRQAVGAVAGCLLVGLGWLGPATDAVETALLYALPDRLFLTVEPGDVRVKPGEPLTIVARTSAARGSLVPDLHVSIAEASRTTRMSAAGDEEFSVGFESVPATFRYRVSVAGRSSPEYTVTLLEAPKVERIDLAYEFPAFTKLAPRVEEDGGDIFAPEGTKVRVTVHTSKPVTSASLALGDGAAVALNAAGGARVEGQLTITADGTYRVALTDADGLEGGSDAEYFIRLLDDRPPDVRVIRPGGDRQVTPLEEVLIEARADDDYGVSEFDLVYALRGGAERVVPFRGERGGLSITGGHTIYLEDLEVQPGDFVSYYARARDIGRGKRPTEARSDIYFLEVKPFEDEFAMAQSQSQGSGSGNQGLDDLVTAQKDLIAATWKLDKRGRGAQSNPAADDVRTLARAQAALKLRTEQAAAMMREPRRRPRAAGPDLAQGDNALAEAATAMGRAHASLDRLRVAEALPSEMEALNHLLRAQAEVRRKEVARQQANAGGGGFNRAQQDLSALFDRELRRQQQTNYETPPTAEERREASRDELLDRVRELARRQEQLARQQEDLARQRDGLDAEELKRRLERLTREQSELRGQAEELARQMARQQAQSQSQQARQGQQGQQSQGQETAQGQSASGGQSGSQGRELREATEEMKNAAGDLRREDPAQASERGARAADRLRQVEQQLRRADPDERRRALGDLQLEARQVADRQRQLAGEASRLGGGDATDARRRLAGEQERLAERVGRLEQQVKEQAAAAAGGAGDRSEQENITGAARELEREKIGDGMRRLAEGLREGSGGEKTADEQRDLARALDRVADRVGGAGAAEDEEGRKLSDQLARARSLSDRLADLERQISAARERAEREAGGAQAPNGQAQGGEGQQGQEGQRSAQGGRQGGEQSAGGESAAGGEGQGGQAAGPGGAGESPARQLARLREEYDRTLRESNELARSLGREDFARGGRGGSTPEGQEMVASAPGTEAFKQDFAKWESLHKDVRLGLEQIEAALSKQLLEKAARDRLRSGSATAAPDDYQRAVERYFRALAEGRK